MAYRKNYDKKEGSIHSSLRRSSPLSMLGGTILPVAFLLHSTGVETHSLFHSLIDWLSAFALILLLLGLLEWWKVEKSAVITHSFKDTPFHKSVSKAVVVIENLRMPKKRTTERTKHLRLSMYLVCVGTVFEIGHLFASGLFPLLTLQEPAILSLTDSHRAIVQQVGLISLIFLFEMTFVAGYAMLAYVIRKMQVFPRWTEVWILGGSWLFGPQMLLPPPVIDLGAALLGLGFIEIGFVNLSQRHWNAERPEVGHEIKRGRAQ